MVISKIIAVAIASLLISCAAFGATELKLDFKESGDFYIAGVEADALPGGFSVKERFFNDAKPNLIFHDEFQDAERLWEPFKGKTETAGCQLMNEGDETFIRVGGEGRFGHGVWQNRSISVKPGGLCEISFKGRVPDLASTFVVYLKFYDSKGRDITSEVPATRGWSYSQYSKTHCLYPIVLGTTNKWENVKLECDVQPGVSGMRFAVCHWRGKHADCAEYSLSEKGGFVAREVVFDERRQTVQNDGSVEGILRSHASALLLKSQWKKGTGGEWTVHAVIEDESQPPKPRAVDIEFRLAMDCIGGRWYRTWRNSREIKADGVYSLVTMAIGSHPIAPYPLTAVENGNVKVALGTPFDKPAFENRVVDANGILSSTAIGLLPLNGHSGHGELDLVLFAFDGDWGFRSAMKKYYELYKPLFMSRTKPREEGTWLWPICPSALPDKAEEFGLAFWEASSSMINKAEVEKAHSLGIHVLEYTEAYGMRQNIEKKPDSNDLSTVSERLSELKHWVDHPEDGKTWFGAPRHIAAQAALNSFPVKTDGEHPYTIDKYDKWTHWWRTNSDPRIPKPNSATLCWDYTVSRNIDLVDGVYLDSLSSFSVDYLNTRPEHLSAMTESLTYDRVTGVPCAHGIQHQAAFIWWIGRLLHEKGKLMFGNIYGIAHRFCAPMIDIFGGEVGEWSGGTPEMCVQDDEMCGMRRFYAYHRPICNLLQEGNFSHPVPEVTAAQMLRYAENQLFYGFYPGVSTIGGEETAGYANWKRYFGKERQCERDRALFKMIVPLIRRLNEAGWEPETLAKCNHRSILVERYGDGLEGREMLFTVRNESDVEAKNVELSMDFDAQSLECIYGDVALQKTDGKTCRMSIGARNTLVLKAK